MSIPASPKPRRKILGCGCSTWLWAIGAILVITVLASLLTDSDNPPAAGTERSGPVPTFTDTVAPPTATPLPVPTDTPIPPTAAPTDTPLPPPTAAPVDLPTATPVPPPAPVEAERAAPVVPLVPAADLSSCDCSANTLNCDDFGPFDAQSCCLRCLALTGRDVHGLDGNNDGTACEWK